MKSIVFVLLALFSTISVVAEPIAISTHGKPTGYQKPGASVRLQTARIKIENPGEVVDVVLTLNSAHFTGVMDVAIREVEGLEVLSGQLSHRFSMTSSGQYNIPLTLYSDSAGSFYLPMLITINGLNGLVSHRALSVIVDVGEPLSISRKVPSSIQISPRGRVIQSMQAQEEILY